MIGKISIQTKMLLIIVSLIIVPKLILAIVDFLAASGKAAAAYYARWSNSDHSGQNSSQNRQDLVRICGL